MKNLFSILLLIPAISFAAPFDLFISQRNIANSATNTITVASPGVGSTGVLLTNPFTGLPQLYRLNNSFFINNSTLTLDSASDWSMVTSKPIFSTVATSGDYNDLINKPSGSQVNPDWSAVSGPAEILNKPALSAVATSGAYSDLSGAPSIPSAQINSDWSAASGPGEILNKPSTIAGYGITDAYPLTGNPSNFLTSITSGQVAAALGFTPYNASNPSSFITQFGARAAITLTNTGSSGPASYNAATGILNVPVYPSGTMTGVTAGAGLSGGTITGSGTISMPNTGTPGVYSGVTTDGQGRVTAGTNRVQAATTRMLNTAFQVSATRDALVNYSVQCTITASIAGGQSCDVLLEIATDAAFTNGVQTVGIIGTGQTYTLAVAIQGVQPQTAQVTGYVPAGYYARLRTVNVSGSPTYAYRAGQEVLQ